MTKEEIKALVKAKIAGQGTMVDVGGALPKVIDGIVDLIPKASAGLGLSGVYTEGGNITIPEGTFAILAAGDYTVSEEDEIAVEEGHIDFYSADAEGVHYVGGITLGSGGSDGLGLAYVVASNPEDSVAPVPEGTFAVFYGGPYGVEDEDSGFHFDLKAGQIAFVSNVNGEYEVEIGTVGGGGSGSGPRVWPMSTEGQEYLDFSLEIAAGETDVVRVPVAFNDEFPRLGDILEFPFIITLADEGEEQEIHTGRAVMISGYAAVEGDTYLDPNMDDITALYGQRILRIYQE